MSDTGTVVAAIFLGYMLLVYGLVKLDKDDKGRKCPPHQWESQLDGLRCMKCQRKPGEVPRNFFGDHVA